MLFVFLQNLVVSITNGRFIAIGSGLATSASQLAKMDVYAVRIYNRALTDDEITHNFNTDKLRFCIK